MYTKGRSGSVYGRIQAGARDASPGVQILSSSCNFRQKNRAPNLGVGATTQENPGSAAAVATEFTLYLLLVARIVTLVVSLAFFCLKILEDGRNL